MKKVKIISNPSSGRQMMQKKLDNLCNRMLDEGYILSKFNTEKKYDAMNETIKACKEDWDLIIACGGDGTVNEVASGIGQSKNKIPVAILSAGTVNDFATHMNIPTDMTKFFEMIKNGKVRDVDLGKVNDNYFLNVAASGILTDIGYRVQPEAKAIFGRLAYYVEGMLEIPRSGIKPIMVNFESKEYSKEEEIMLYIVSNSASIGGFKKLAPDASVSDGFLDVLIIKKSEVQEIANIFLSIFKGEHINHPNVSYFKTNKLKVSSKEKLTIDIDGEYGGVLPGEYTIEANGIKLLVP